MVGCYPYKLIYYLGNVKWKELVFVFLGKISEKSYIYIYICACIIYYIRLAPPSNKHLTARKFPNSSHHQYFPPVSEQFTKRPRRLLEEIYIYIYIYYNNYKTLISHHGNTTINKYLLHPPNQGKICFGNFVRAAFKASIFPIFAGITPTNFPISQHTNVLLFGHLFPIASESTTPITCRQHTDMF